MVHSLKNVFLLEDGLVHGTITMHGVVHAFALWYMSTHDAENFLVMPGHNLKSIDQRRFSSSLQRISLMHNCLQRLPESVVVSRDAVSLLLQGNKDLKEIPGTFLQAFPALRILNVCETGIKYFPATIVSLDKHHTLTMKDCEHLEEIPLFNPSLLRLIDLSGTRIRELPKWFVLLTKLAHLFLRDTNHLESIPTTVISQLLKLETLDMTRSAYQWKTKGQATVGQATADEIWSLKELRVVFIWVADLGFFTDDCVSDQKTA